MANGSVSWVVTLKESTKTAVDTEPGPNAPLVNATIGVAETTDDAALVPKLVVLDILKSYSVPLSSPVTVADKSVESPLPGPNTSISSIATFVAVKVIFTKRASTGSNLTSMVSEPSMIPSNEDVEEATISVYSVESLSSLPFAYTASFEETSMTNCPGSRSSREPVLSRPNVIAPISKSAPRSTLSHSPGEPVEAMLGIQLAPFP